MSSCCVGTSSDVEVLDLTYGACSDELWLVSSTSHLMNLRNSCRAHRHVKLGLGVGLWSG